ncbi:MAG TPA: hypothetical protein DF296_04480 [Candidatus Margulisbacteria bacterium]|nr:MAG: hypothetical protein A2X42_04710 [Candidatus Margulisbacteria bacterium GWF2_38_17]OGI05982.1 MAG: hypothetical protein A2X41_12220 [Candidatus Margulisbacteria bacterium GWE2_39_32]HCT84439.1 hypothetical protein [Candidatus Margulisiibacteriota bacterium]
MKLKIIDVKPKWINPYKSLQDQFRSMLNKELSRNNGIISEETFQNAFINCKKLTNLRQRLFIPNNNQLEWKPEIVNVEMLAKKIGKPISELDPLIIEVFNRSRQMDNRCRYPYLAYANRNNLIKHDSIDPVYGIDVLIRPVTSFTESEEKKNNFFIGSHSLALFLHVDLDEKMEVRNSSNFMFRASVGTDLMQSGINKYLNPRLSVIGPLLIPLLRDKNYTELITLSLSSVNEGIHRFLFHGI